MYVFWKVFKKVYKTISESISCNVADFFTRRSLKGKLCSQRALQGHSKVTPRALGNSSTRRALGHSRYLGTQDNWALGHSSTWGTRALKTLGHLGTRALEGHSKSTWTLRHLNTQGTRGTLFSRLLQMSKISHLVLYWKCFHVFDYITTIAKFFKEMSFLSITFWNLLYKRKFFLPSVNISKI